MHKFASINSLCIPLLIDNIDTDMIIPSREMRSTSKSGLKDGLFAPWRYLNERERVPNSEFILNQQEFKDAKILIAGKNFGCGSSREHAVWALMEYGFRAIIAESFAPIFYNNALRNGLLAISMDIEKSHQFSGREIHIDLSSQQITYGDLTYVFSIDELRKQMLIAGQDEIEFTLSKNDVISGFFEKQEIEFPWIKLGFTHGSN